MKYKYLEICSFADLLNKFPVSWHLYVKWMQPMWIRSCITKSFTSFEPWSRPLDGTKGQHIVIKVRYELMKSWFYKGSWHVMWMFSSYKTKGFYQKYLYNLFLCDDKTLCLVSSSSLFLHRNLQHLLISEFSGINNKMLITRLQTFLELNFEKN